MRTYMTFGDIEGKLDTLIVECTRCQRKGRYSVAIRCIIISVAFLFRLSPHR
jgi:hypothetical protein